MAVKEDGLRADARANRDRILEVAREALTADPETPLSAIGKAAGVGQGTLYRHFPTREALALAMYRKEISAVVALASTLLEAHPPLEAFRLWCAQLADSSAMKRGVARLLQGATSEDDKRETYQQMVSAVRSLLTACEGVGAIDRGANADDVLMLLGVLWQLPSHPGRDAQSARIIALILRGLGAKD
ncbi:MULTISPECIES: TetR/AcrR family transcriptional regulator [unclassified Sphingomonas]|jgi:AcrR family transcriptional regulator|uniref:TetR/AcrR family transcriptional regulator n=1 Tax=unclassified Sphingomonas TaxID=196159 RepID=UPI000927FD75|nr:MULTISPECIES: TetR/AcrR family transcriptional regulator [unclassified Sphingomonas]OJU17744.1 MAG: TetR family transcriptional regulator [Sphingomonas sp. 66-10]